MKRGSLTPIPWRAAPAGLVSGPRKLKIVRTASSFRTGTTKRVAWWCAGANMKPKPAPRMHSATPSGPRSMRAPRASSRSALPDRLVALRLPCLATAQPAPAAMIAAVVETLKVGRPPPVPAVSSRSSRPHSTRVARARIVRASPASSSPVSPLARSAMRKPAICTSLASPAMMTASTAAASSADSERPDATASMACVRISSGIQEVAKQRPPLVGEHRLGVELHALGGQLAVADGHHDPAASGRDLERVGQRLLLHDEGVIAPDGQRRRDPVEDRAAVVLDRRRLAVHREMADDGAAEGLGERLVAEADAQRRHPGLGEALDDVEADPRLVGRARTGRDDDAVGPAREQLLDVRGVVAHDVELAAQLAQVLDEVVGERVVVVDDEDAHQAQSGCSQASAIASRTARDFATDSSNS